MPNRYGFNLLGPEVACIEDGCDARGPAHEWPEEKQQQHQRDHVKAIFEAAARKKRAQAREARRLAKLKEKENVMAYGE